MPVLFTPGFSFPAIGKASVSAPPIHGPAIIQKALVLFEISGKHDPVCLAVATFPAPFPDIVRNGCRFFGVDVRVTIAFLRVVWWIEKQPTRAAIVLPVTTTNAGPVSADYPDTAQAFRELAEPLIQAGSIGITDIKQRCRLFIDKRDFMDTMSTRGPVGRTPADTHLMIEERDLLIGTLPFPG